MQSMAEQPTRKCPVCGAAIDWAARQCPACGEKFQQSVEPERLGAVATIVRGISTLGLGVAIGIAMGAAIGGTLVVLFVVFG